MQASAVLLAGFPWTGPARAHTHWPLVGGAEYITGEARQHTEGPLVQGRL